ncbi:hypothetical protein Tco_0367822 [Tanacetum coccineum]
MNPVAAQQVALDNALVAPEKQLKIGKCNMRIEFNKPQREPLFQVTLAALKLSPCYPAIMITAEVLEIYMHQFWNTIKKIKDTDAYQFKCISGKSTDFMFQADNKEISSARKQNMPYPRFTKVIISHFISKDKTISMRNMINLYIIQDDSLLGTLKYVSKIDDYQKYGALIPKEMINQAIKDSKAYKIYLAFATGKATPKKARKFKKIASPLKKQTLFLEDEPAKKPKKKSTSVQIKDTPDVSVSKKKAPATTDRSKGIDLLSEAALLEDAQLKKALKRSKRDTTIHQAGGSSEGADSEFRVPDEPKADEQSDDDHEQADDERTKSDDEEEETQDDEYTHTLEGYVPTDDETNDESDYVTKDEYERINEELYGDVNVSLTDIEPADKEKDKEMTIAGQVNVNKRVQVIKSRMMLSHNCFVNNYFFSSVFTLSSPSQLTPIPTLTTTEATTSTTAVPDSETLSYFHQRITNLEKDVKKLKTVDHSTSLLLTIKSEVPNSVKEYLGTSLDDALYKVLKKHNADIIKEHYVPSEIIERLRQQYVPEKSTKEIKKIKIEHARNQQEPKETITSSDTSTFEEFDQKLTLFQTMTNSKSFNRGPKQRALYHALMESILEDKDAMDEGVADKLKKRKQDDADKDKGPSAGSNRGLKRHKTSKDTKPSKKAKSTESSKCTSKSQPRSTDKSAQAEEPVFEAGDTQGEQNQG